MGIDRHRFPLFRRFGIHRRIARRLRGAGNEEKQRPRSQNNTRHHHVSHKESEGQ
jgi:hypothetical protein